MAKKKNKKKRKKSRKSKRKIKKLRKRKKIKKKSKRTKSSGSSELIFKVPKRWANNAYVDKAKYENLFKPQNKMSPPAVFMKVILIICLH